eukprot:TRINITY_DN4563_c0_g1::TRINITY_DN4563_c0_g1_i1::g.23220::m.23220 TRINITY_DN4563_c0_g1::TRINITY_DN4563_c0_g1_i1::g.23220  ORF type:complete len:202 (+),score=3.84,sp/Q54P14/COMD2_DICDI/32.12/1e-22,HCaRG/PF07258.9/4.7e-24 TRINITY_DN4563_c0_g1_i1:116-721(+)
MLTLLSKQLADLELLAALDSGVLAEFCQVAVSIFAGSQPNKKVFANAAKTLNCTQEDIARAVSALSYLFAEIVRAHSKLNDLRDAFKVHGVQLNEECTTIIYNKCEENQKLIQEVLDRPMIGEHLQSINWRLNITIGSRSLRQQNEPSYLLEFRTKDPEGVERDYLLESDYASLRTMTTEFEAALVEARKTEYRRVTKYIK